MTLRTVKLSRNKLCKQVFHQVRKRGRFIAESISFRSCDTARKSEVTLSRFAETKIRFANRSSLLQLPSSAAFFLFSTQLCLC